MLRVFDREQLALVPAVQLAAPLPELERLRRGTEPQSSGLEWVGPDGRTWLETYGTKDGLAPYYNLLDRRVQQAVLQLAAELFDRYGHHPALVGLAVQLSSDGYAQLPPLEWGLDDATVSRFSADCGIAIEASGPNRFAVRHALLTGTHAEKWRAWRATQVTEFYAQLAALVRQGNKRRRLLLTTEQTFDHPTLKARILPKILDESRVHSTLLSLGIVGTQLGDVPGVVVCPTRYLEPIRPLVDRAVDLEINEAFAAPRTDVNTNDTSAALFYHRSKHLTLSSLAAKSPIPVADDFRLICQPLAYEAAVRRPYATSVADNDLNVLLDGGELLPIGQEDILRNVRLILQRLPVSARISDVHQQPILVRTYAGPNTTTLLVVNTCPWPTDAQVLLDLPHAVTAEPLAGGESIDAPAVVIAAGRPWSLSLEPYAMHAVSLAAPAKVMAVRAQVVPSSRTELQTRLSQLIPDAEPRIYTSLTNPGFEVVGGGGVLPGWRLLAERARCNQSS
jgi:hypothetical protein